MNTTWRCWLTGGVAAVMAAASQATPTGARRIRRTSDYPLEETLDRLRQQAQRSGVPVLATVREPSPPGLFGHSTARLLVLGSDAEHTPVLQRTGDAALALPLTVRIVPAEGDRSEVEFTDSGWLIGDAAPSDDEPDDRSTAWLSHVMGLPQLVDDALRPAA